jgi:predicted O-methyltransferase YrrM
MIFEAPLGSLITRKHPASIQAEVETVAAIRQRIAVRGDEVIPIYYSPKPGARYEDGRPKHGELKTFKARDLALKTSVPEYCGIFLHHLARTAESKVILELGSCVGVGAAYLASSPYCTEFYSIEASRALAGIARESVQTVKPDGEVIHGLFDPVLDDLLPRLSNGIDFTWIDGHHEKLATIHYFERLIPHLNPGALVAFDDIYWSQDMLDGWNELRVREGFSHSLDFGPGGICIWEGGDAVPRQWNFNPYVGSGNWTPKKPAGWS